MAVGQSAVKLWTPPVPKATELSWHSLGKRSALLSFLLCLVFLSASHFSSRLVCVCVCVCVC